MYYKLNFLFSSFLSLRLRGLNFLLAPSQHSGLFIWVAKKISFSTPILSSCTPLLFGSHNSLFFSHATNIAHTHTYLFSPSTYTNCHTPLIHLFFPRHPLSLFCTFCHLKVIIFFFIYFLAT